MLIPRPLPRSLPRSLTLSALTLASLAHCTGGDPAINTPATGPGTGPRVVWDLGHRPLPEIPIPNDLATYRDDNSPTGLRINASLVAPTRLESAFRAQFDELDGWGVYQGITIPFPPGTELDLGNIVRRHQGDHYEFRDDVVYLVDLGPNDPTIPAADPRYGHPGTPIPLDMGEGNFQFTYRSQDPLFVNDLRAGESNLVFETIDEDLNHDGLLQASEDTNFDGVLGRPSVYPYGGNSYDHLTTFWDATASTLILRPLVPLLENHRYAVVVTDRLTARDGQPVRSPFDTITHPTQAESLAALDSMLGSPTLYGDLHWRSRPTDLAGSAHVAFAWRYTTQTAASEWFAVRDGIYGHGPFSRLATDFPPRVTPMNTTLGSSSCSNARRARPYVFPHDPAAPPGDPVRSLFEVIWNFEDPGPTARQAQLDSYRNVAYVVVGSFHAPFLLSSDPRGDTNPHAHWQLNPRTGEIRHAGDAEIPFMLVVPRATPGVSQPFPTAVYLHGYGAGVTESFVAAGILAQNGVATITFDGPTHGLPLTPQLRSQAATLLRGSCTVSVIDLLNRTNRARDLNGSGIVDPAGDFWTGYIVHSRDNVRQYALETSQLLRGLREWNGTTRAGIDIDNNGSTDNDIAGDFDGDGVPDVGSGSHFYAIGESLGGIMSMLVGGTEPLVP